MAKVTIWHNPRCSKSRNSMALLEEKGVDAEVVKYLDTPPTKEELKMVLSQGCKRTHANQRKCLGRTSVLI